MSVDRNQKQWTCGKAGAISLNRVSSIVRDIGEPCLYQSPIKRTKMLKPDKWKATFDCDGKIYGFHRVLKLIILGGVDPSIRPEVWEFLLGCYTLSSTAEYRRQLRTARRERYRELISQCQSMHSSIGTGSLAYVVGSKVMDVRTISKDDRKEEVESQSNQAGDDKFDKLSESDNNGMDTSHVGGSEISGDCTVPVSVRESTDGAAYDASCSIAASVSCKCISSEPGSEECGSKYVNENYFDFPPLPVTNLFENSGKGKKKHRPHEGRLATRRKLKFENEHLHSFRISNNSDLVRESNGSPSNDGHRSFDIQSVDSDGCRPVPKSNSLEIKAEIVNTFRISDPTGMPVSNTATSLGQDISEEKVSEWLWTLHRIVVDVVRTDSHLEFYEDTKNLARMSDILAVYAWVDPATGYCQGMSDLLSPFVVLFEDNADAFWCFEMLLRRMRENFQMEGPTGVMKQLQSLWHILEHTDWEMFDHLSRIGAESLHFAFRMLLVLFRRELSFSESLSMWEMMWAADFHESMVSDLDENCPDLLVIEIPKEPCTEMEEDSIENANGDLKFEHHSKIGNVENGGDFHSKPGNVECAVTDSNGMKSISVHPFCGLTKSLWPGNDALHVDLVCSSKRHRDDELPVFCVAAILIMNHHKIIRDTRSIDDLIKIFNDKMLRIRVKRCVRTAIKLRKKYFYKLIKSRNLATSNSD